MKFSTLFRSNGFWGLIRLTGDVASTKVQYPQAKVIRPFYIRGNGNVELGSGFTSGPSLRIDSLGNMTRAVIGRDVQVNNFVHIGAVNSVVIGRRVLLDSGVFISDHNHGTYSGSGQTSPLSPPALRSLQVIPVEIEPHVGLGEHVCVLPGAKIGKGTKVGAGSVVTSSLPEYVIEVGAPARAIRRFDFEQQVWLPIQ